MVKKSHASATFARTIAIAFGLSLFQAPAHSEGQGFHGHGHDKLHHWYSQLMRPDFPSSSCCNKEDCRPTEARWTGHNWEAQKDGRWVSVPNEKVNREESYDSQAHICAPAKSSTAYAPDYIFCFVKPGAGI